MADELIRYNRIKSFMLQPQTYLSFGNIGYNLKDDEIILIQSLLTQEYFEGLIPSITNKYINFNSYDEVEPIRSQTYENTIDLFKENNSKKNEYICDKKINATITSSVWRSCFPENYGEIDYGKTIFCTFDFIIDLIEKKTGDKYTVNQIKNLLYEEYKKYLDNYHDKIIDILIFEGKKTLGDQVHSKILTFSNFLYTDNYFLTTFDLWLLIVKFEIPTIFISQKWILQTKYEKHEFLGYGNKSDNFVFIIIPGFRPENIPIYKVVISDTNDIFIPLNKINSECVDRIYTAIDNIITIEKYLQDFSKSNKTLYSKKKPINLIELNTNAKPKVQRKKIKIIDSTTSPLLEEEQEEIIVPIKKQTKKLVIKGKNPTKKIRKSKIKIIDETSSNSK
jgi:hypothetical protein